MTEIAQESIRILVVDDHELFRKGLLRLLEVEHDFQLLPGCSSVQDALDSVAAEPPDIVLLDVDLGNERGPEFLVKARKAGFTGKVLVVTAGLSESDAVHMMREGAVGIFLKHNSPELLALTIRRVMNGEICLDEHYFRLMLDHDFKQEERRVRFTERDRQVLRGVFEGLTNKEIADRLQVSESAIKASLQQLFNKTGVRTRSQLVRITLERYHDEL